MDLITCPTLSLLQASFSSSIFSMALHANRCVNSSCTPPTWCVAWWLC